MSFVHIRHAILQAVVYTEHICAIVFLIPMFVYETYTPLVDYGVPSSPGACFHMDYSRFGVLFFTVTSYAICILHWSLNDDHLSVVAEALLSVHTLKD